MKFQYQLVDSRSLALLALWIQATGMPKKKTKLPALADVPGRPGFSIINRYMPDASDAEKEQAYENLKSLGVVLRQIDERIGNIQSLADPGLS